jgi:hypothetical protein
MIRTLAKNGILCHFPPPFANAVLPRQAGALGTTYRLFRPEVRTTAPFLQQAGDLARQSLRSAPVVHYSFLHASFPCGCRRPAKNPLRKKTPTRSMSRPALECAPGCTQALPISAILVGGRTLSPVRVVLVFFTPQACPQRAEGWGAADEFFRKKRQQ